MRTHWRIIVAALLLAAPLHAQDLDLGGGGGEAEQLFGDLTEAMEADADASWWDAAWRYRRRVVVADARLALQSGLVYLAEPDPLVLYNTRGCAPGLADLRAVGLDGKPIPCGVVAWGQDDGYGMIWLDLGRGKAARRAFYLYYGNPDAAPAAPPPKTPRPVVGLPKRLVALSEPGAEETAPGAAPPPSEGDGAFFAGLVTVEAEDGVDAEGRQALWFRGGSNRDRTSRSLWRVATADASAGSFVASVAPHRPNRQTETQRLRTSVTLPRAGEWRVHVRSKVTDYKDHDAGQVKHVTHSRYRPYTLHIGEQALPCGADQGPGADFRWDSFTVTLPAGALPLVFEMPGLSGPDCVLFTQDPRYQPDHRDVSGPLWLRVRARGETLPPYFVDLFCYTRPWTDAGPQGETAGYAFRYQAVGAAAEAEVLARDAAALIPPGEWSAWLRARQIRSPQWWSHVRFHAAGWQAEAAGIVADARSIPNLTVDFQFATAPDPTRVFRSGTETLGATGDSRPLRVLMPRAADLASLREGTLSFAQWSQRRYALVEAMDLPTGPRPDRLFFTTRASTVSEAETRSTLAILQRLGFNGLRLASPLAPEAAWALSDAADLHATETPHWRPEPGTPAFLRPFLQPPAPGADPQDAIQTLLAAAARDCYRPDAPIWSRNADSVARSRLVLMGDEIFPVVGALHISIFPLLTAHFHTYLRDQGLRPADFGAADWDAVIPADARHVPPLDSRLYRLLMQTDPGLEQALLRLDPDLATRKAARDVPTDAAAAMTDRRDVDLLADLLEEDLSGADTDVLRVQDAPPAAADADDANTDGDPPDATDADALPPAADLAGEALLHAKRLHYWTQRYRSHFTILYYRACSAELARLAAQGAFRQPPFASPNFQAQPIHHGQMWTGALNLFDWGRAGGTDHMLMEDWCGDTYRVAFGMELLRAAARRRGQPLGAIVVGGRPAQRLMVDLGNECRVFLSYLYGPVRETGPTWADDPATIRQWAEVLHSVGRYEADILAAKRRAAPIAILVDNSAELNSHYLNTAYANGPLTERIALYSGLRDAGYEVEVVGAEEILLDDALARYRVLYVSDPHLHRDVQTRIRDWVQQGGVLWASYAAGARSEYDETSVTLNPVFGLAARPPLQDAPTDWEPEEALAIEVPASALLPAQSITSVPLRVDYQVAGGEALARYTDGGAALLQNRFGQGQAFLYGGVAQTLAGGTGRYVDEAAGAADRRAVLSLAARAAGLEPSLRCDVPRVLRYIHDGPASSVLYLARPQRGGPDAITLDVALPRRPTSAHSGSGAEIPVTWHGDHARITIALPTDSGDLVVFRY